MSRIGQPNQANPKSRQPTFGTIQGYNQPNNLADILRNQNKLERKTSITSFGSLNQSINDGKIGGLNRINSVHQLSLNKGPSIGSQAYKEIMTPAVAGGQRLP
jgi:hypothetical protein